MLLLDEKGTFSILGMIQSGIFFIASYIYIWLYVNPVLYYQQQQPAFLINERFFNGYLSYPGGLTEYIAAFISQFYIFPWIGALFIVGIIWLITLCTSAIIKSVYVNKEILLIKYIPALLLLCLYSYYDYTLSASIGLLIVLFFTVLYLKLSPQYKYIRIVLFLVYAIITFYLTAGSMALFALICLLHELIHKRNVINAISYVIIGVIIFYFAPNFFLIPAKDVLINLVSMDDTLWPEIIQYILLLFYPITYLLFMYLPKPDSNTDKKDSIVGKIVNLSDSKIVSILQPFILVILIIVIAYFSGNRNNRVLLQIEYYANNDKWNKVLTFAEDKVNDNMLIAFQLNRALYHLSMLPDSMFAFSQKWGENGLILPSTVSPIFPLKRSDLFFEIGHLNEAEHMAYEALALNENFPWIIQRLALLNILNGKEQAARNCLSLLDKTLFYKDWAAKYKKYIGNRAMLAGDKKLSTIKSGAPNKDFLVDNQNPFNDLAAILDQKNANKMAFEYLMMYYLMKGKLGKFINQIDEMNLYGYKSIPRHFEEAMILYRAQGGPKKFKMRADHSNRSALARFRRLQQILAKYNGDKKSAHKELQEKYSDTYWYYLLYNLNK